MMSFALEELLERLAYFLCCQHSYDWFLYIYSDKLCLSAQIYKKRAVLPENMALKGVKNRRILCSAVAAVRASVAYKARTAGFAMCFEEWGIFRRAEQRVADRAEFEQGFAAIVVES